MKMRRTTIDHLTEPNPELAALVRNTSAGMAHWAGTGPAGKTCGECDFFVHVEIDLGTSTRCDKYRQMMNGKRGTERIPENTQACKYFEQACDPPAAEPSAIRRRNCHARFRQADVVRVLKAITKAGFGSVGWRVRIEPDGCILIEPGQPLAQHELQGANEWDDLIDK
jgi:hypothetical protein